MMQYLVTIYHPDDYDPSVEDEAMSREIDALNDEMVATGVRIFVGGLHPASSQAMAGACDELLSSHLAWSRLTYEQIDPKKYDLPLVQ